MPTLTFQRTISAPPETIFDLCRSIDFHLQAAQTIKARAIAHRTTGLAQLHDQTTYSASFFGLRFRLTTRITTCESPHTLTDEMVQGLFKTFSHHYTLRTTPKGTLLQDRFTFIAPLGPFGHLLETLFLSPVMTKAQNERLDAIQIEAQKKTTGNSERYQANNHS